MPKESRGIGKKKKPSQPTTVLCKCKGRCLNYNETTGRHEGPGQHVTSDTRVRHRRDDRLRALMERVAENKSVEVPSPRIPIPPENDGDDDWLPLIRIHLQILEELPLPDMESLEFVHSPKDGPEFQYQYAQDDGTAEWAQSLPNLGPHALKPVSLANRHYISKENTYWELYRTLQGFKETDESIELQQEIYDHLVVMERGKAMRWETLRSGSRFNGGVAFFNSEVFFRSRKTMAKAIDASSALSLVLQFIYFLPRRGCEAYLAGISDVLSSLRQVARIPTIPKDPRPLPTRFHLDPITTPYITCPRCHFLYPHLGGASLAPEACTFRKTPSSEPCGAPIWKSVDRGPFGQHKAPVRKYLHQPLQPWLARLLARPSIEETIHDYPRECMARPHNGALQDIWEGEVFRSVVDSDNQPFLPGPPGELRLAFSLSIDGFGPFGNKTAKQTASSTGIWMVLLNLPEHLRYLPHNIYLAGVIPGPHKPSNDEINHYVKLIVDDLKPFWGHGVYFSRTYARPRGRLCKGLLIPLVCDLLSAHQVIGYPGAPTAHYFCTRCELDIHDINIVDSSEWPAKDARHIRRYAELYRDAETERDRQAIFAACGWRWSPLFELPYWNPSLFTVIDSMHALDLNLIQNHIRKLLRIDMDHRGGEALRPPTERGPKRVVSRKSELASLRACQELIRENPPELLYRLLSFDRKILFTFCLDYDIRTQGQKTVTGTRWILSLNIYRWRQKNNTVSLATFLKTYPRLSSQQVALLEASVADFDRETTPHDDSDSDSEAESALRPSTADIEGNTVEVEQDLNPKTVRAQARRLLRLSRGDEGLTAATVYASVTVRMLKHFFAMLGIDEEEMGDPSRSQGRTNKRQLFDHLVEKLQQDPNIEEDMSAQFEGTQDEEATQKANAFLGKDVMEEVWRDMERTQLPSWMTPVPRDWGTVRRGKLSADNWRIICCVHLPITLIRLFGHSSGRTLDLLDNFMHLVKAIRIATMKRTSPRQIEAYRTHIFAYTEGTLELFPDYAILPTHHASLHLVEMFSGFGPKHSHDSPYYERYINFFHRMNHNGKLGEVEATFLRTAMRSVNLLALLMENDDTRSLVDAMVKRLEKHQREQLRGFRLSELLTPPVLEGGMEGVAAASSGGRPSTLTPEELEMLRRLQYPHLHPGDYISPQITLLDAVSHNQAVYAPWSSLKYKDSRVLFRTTHGNEAGVIQKIFMHPNAHGNNRQCYVLLDEYEATEENADIFRKYGYAGGFCCRAPPSTRRLITLDSVICHVALTDFGELGVVHILPINKSLLSFEIDSYDEANGTAPM